MPQVETIVLVREPAASMADCELTHLERVAIDAHRAREQHSHYVSTLVELGARAEWLPALHEHPDGVFVEDTAIILPEVAVLGRPGVRSRLAEVLSVEPALADHRLIRRISPPAFLDGGDVLLMGRRLLVGLSSRTNEAGVAQLRTAVEQFGYAVHAVRTSGCLHLKSACTAISSDTVVANPEYIDRAELGAVTVIEVDVREPRAANTLTLGGVTLVSTSYPRTEEKLRRAGVRTQLIDVSELEKAESGLTCMSLVISAA